MKPLKELMALIEALLFLRGEEGTSLSELTQFFPQEKPSNLEQVVISLTTKYLQDESSAFAIQKFGRQKYRLHTKTTLYDFLTQAKIAESANKLTLSTLEVLTIIAYQGPISRAEIENLRQSDCSYQITKLKERGLIQSLTKKPENRAYLYTVSDNFYKFFNLSTTEFPLPPVILNAQAPLSENHRDPHPQPLFNSQDYDFPKEIGEN